MRRSSGILNIPAEPAGVDTIARRSRGTPRIANRLLRRVRDYAQVKGDGSITEEIAGKALDMMEVDPHGLDWMDRQLLRAIMEKFDGGPVGIDSLAAAVGEERGTLEDVIEPYLIQQGFMMRTPRGRMVTKRTWAYFGLTDPKQDGQAQTSLFAKE